MIDTSESVGEPTAWHARTTAQVAEALRSDTRNGLSAAEAAHRLNEAGPNELRRQRAVSPVQIFAAQFKSLVIWVLIGVAAVSAALGEMIDSIAIITIVVLNACIGFFQEYRAEQAVAALARMTAPRARVVRDGHSLVVPAAEVVRGDVLMLESGDLVAADARLVETANLRANEAPLTGESQPVGKQTGLLAATTPLADRHNLVFLGTSIASGGGRALVVGTGMATEVGHIAALLATAGVQETPLQQRLDRVARHLLWACLGIVVVFFALGFVRGDQPFALFLGAVSLAVAAIPEGLPAVVTVALALGVQRMIRRNALVRHLPAVETLGCVEVICTDKTGTLTVGEMTVRRVITFDRVYAVSGEGYAPTGAFYVGGATAQPTEEPVLLDLLRAATACNDAELSQQQGRAGVVGDPTEGALLVAAAKAGILRAAIDASRPRFGTIPFDSDRKRMTVACMRGDQPWSYVKGAPEVILARCRRVLTAQGAIELGDSDRARMVQAARMLANDALRVLAIAERPLAVAAAAALEDPETAETDLTLLGVVGLQDPPRAEARAAVARCRDAGIRTVMITGDHPDTARAIARELGILEAGDEVVVGVDLCAMTDADLRGRVPRTAVFARVTAEDKLRIVRAWKARGAVVAMTGDGVNDAPAIKAASIGVAMGRSGTEVTKEASDIIITDDNFASIVAAVEEGRGIYDNIRKTLGYLLAGNTAELAVMLCATLVGWPLPLLPLHLLWINLVTDGLPALALATDPIDRDVLTRAPRRPEAELLDRSFMLTTLLTGTLTAAVTLAAFGYEYHANGSVDQARDAAFTALVIAELMRAFGARSATQTVWEIGLFANIRLFGIVAISFALQIAIHHSPMLQALFDIEPVTMDQCLAWTMLGFVPLAVLELRKVANRRRGEASTLSHAGGAGS